MLICQLFALTAARAASGDLVEHARQLQLANATGWRDLLHMQVGVSPGRSEVDDARFFLAANGHASAQAELEATIRGFTEADTLACLFPARWHWLQQYLDLGARPACPELDGWKQKLAAQQLTLLFPAMYLQNPASMFGHTFLRLDQHNKSPLLAYTLSYAARPDRTDNLALYVYKGVFGGYPGVFAVQPYYQTVTDYGDIEHRDIWEYALNLTPAEIDQLLNHVWELRDKHIDYYFLRENCAYQLLSLLNVARPGMQLSHNRFPLYAMPADTVRSVAAAGLIDRADYRPARASRIAHMYTQLDAWSQQKALLCAESSDCIAHDCADCEQSVTQLPEIQQAQILELAAEIKLLNNIHADTVLSQRSLLETPANWLPFVNTDPVASHESARWRISAGRYAHQHYVETGVRPALHDWLDNDAGLITGATLEILSARLRYYPDDERLQLQQLTLFGMQSFSPVTPWHTPLSSEMKIGMERINNHKLYLAEGAVGLSAKTGVWHYFALASLAVESMPARQQDEAAYLGAHAGVRSEIFFGRLLLQAKWLNSVAGYDETRNQFQAGYQWDISRDYALRMDYVVRRSEYFDERDVQIGLLGYF